MSAVFPGQSLNSLTKQQMNEPNNVLNPQNNSRHVVIGRQVEVSESYLTTV